ncbi:hypothetical protein ES703_31875 [subsurface metagenome]
MTTANAETLAQHKPTSDIKTNTIPLNTTTLLDRLTYGVPAPRRMLPPSLLLKKHHYIRTYLVSLGLTPAEKDAAFYLLRLYAYYGKVYPKAPNYTEDCYRSKRSFWRTVAKLQDSGLIDRINRYLNHLQISNCYRLDKLVLCIIRYLAEHGCPYLPDFAHDLLRQVGVSFWHTIRTLRVRLRDPNPLTTMA